MEIDVEVGELRDRLIALEKRHLALELFFIARTAHEAAWTRDATKAGLAICNDAVRRLEGYGPEVAWMAHDDTLRLVENLKAVIAADEAEKL